jgi:diguanylate cyclase (GGDEF)-like protein/PAS domain S-box-containing protein
MEVHDHRVAALHDYQAIVESIPGIVFIAATDVEAPWHYVNEWIEPILGFTAEEWTTTPALWLNQLHPEDRGFVLSAEAQELEAHTAASTPADVDRTPNVFMDYRMLHKDGRVVWIRDSSVLVEGPDGTLQWQGVLMDISDQKEAALRLQRGAAAQAAVARLGRQALAGTAVAELLDEACSSLVEVLDAERARAMQVGDEPSTLTLRSSVGWEELPGEYQCRDVTPRTATGYTMLTGTPLLVTDWEREERFELHEDVRPIGLRSSMTARIEGAGHPWGTIAVSSARPDAFSEHNLDFLSSIANVLADAIARQQADEVMQHRALHDALTGLPNRVLFSDRLTQAIERSRRHANALSAVLFVDVDHFKHINDTLGHGAGDELLVNVASRLREVVRPTDTVARFGGDEFGLLLEEVSSERDAIATAERIAASFARPFVLETSSQFVTVSIGIALADGHADAGALLTNADAAMYRAKQRGRARYDLFDEDLRARVLARGRLESDLQRALELGEMHLEYQPIVRLGTETIYAVEVLLRWDHAHRGPVLPNDFIPVAEESGLIDRIGQWVLRESLRDAARWEQQFPDFTPLSLGINTSVPQLQNPRFPDLLGDIIASSGIDPMCVHLELDEHVLRGDAGQLQRALREVKRLGVRLLIHNFGTGASSLTQLATLPIDAIKVDRRFITRLSGHDEAARISRAAIATGLSLGLSVVGLGVETADEARELRRFGASSAQGDLYGGAVSAAEIGELIANPQRLRRTL